MGLQHVINAGAELVTAPAAAKEGVGFTMSAWASTSMEDLVYHCSGGVKFLNLYIYKNREWTQKLAHRAENCGFHGLVLGFPRAVPRSGQKSAVLGGARFANLSPYLERPSTDQYTSLCDLSTTWKDVAWLKSITKLPVIVKGVMTDRDARAALAHGADAVLVSNHGGRQLDAGIATMDCLEEVVTAVGEHCEVYLDGGVRSGIDIFKALTLGARAVFVGRPILWGLAHSGEDGVRSVIKKLKQELEATMISLGVSDINVIPKDVVMHRRRLCRL